MNRLVRSLRLRGAFNTCRLALRWGCWRLAPRGADKVERWLVDRSERRFDRRFGTRTLSERGQFPTDATGQSGSDGLTYEATTPGTFRLIVRSARVEPASWSFVDIGCGKGKLLLLAAECGFSEVIGIEHSASLARTAKLNIDAYMRHRPNSPPIRALEGDGAELELPAGKIFLYLYNPFGEATLGRLVDRLRMSLRARPQPLVIAYSNPVHASVLESSGIFRREAVLEPLLQKTCLIYSNSAPVRGGAGPDVAAGGVR